MRFRKLLFLFIFIFISITSFSQFVKNIGIPFYKNFAPEDIKSHPQSWQITQDSTGIIYVANQAGILIYNGNDWKTKTIAGVRSIFYNNNKIYYGAENEFGYIFKDSIGKYQTKILSQESKDSTTSCFILNIFTENNFTYFIGINKIYVFKNDTIFNTYVSKNGFRYCHKVNNHLFTRNIDEGIDELKNGKLLKVENTQIFKETTISFIVDYKKDSFLVGTKSNGLYLLEGKNNKFKINKITTDFDNFILTNTITRGASLKNDKIAIGTSFNGLIIINKNFEILDFYNAEQILLNNTINDIFQDNENNLWIATNNGITFINYSTKIKKIQLNKLGIKTLVLSPILFKRNLYFSSFSGFFKISKIDINKNPNTGIPYKTKKISELNESFMSVLNLNKSLILDGRNGVYEYDGNKITKILSNQLNVSSYCFPFDSSYIFISSFNGITLMKKQKDKWKKLGKIYGFNQEIRFYRAINKNELFIANQNMPPVKLSFNNIEDLVNKNFTLKKYDFPKDFIKTNVSEINCIEGNIFFYSNFKLYKYNKINNKFVADSTYIHYNNDNENNTCLPGTPAIKNELYLNDTIFYYTNSSTISELIKDKNNNFEISTLPFRTLPTTAYFDLNKYNNTLYFSGPSGLFYYYINNTKRYKTKYNTLITSVIVKKDTISFTESNSTKILNFNKRNIKFLFTSLFFEKSSQNKYQYILEGYNDKWSTWSSEKYAIYTNLPFGDYVFKVKSKNIYGNESNTASYSFKILAPWYLKWWVIIFEVILILILIWIIFKLYTNRLKRQNQKLEETVNKRTKELYKSNQELEKLSIVAREIDNSVLIMNPLGDYIWVNESLSKKIGSALNDKIINIKDSSSNKDIAVIFNECVKNKKSVVYENFTLKNDNEKIWSRTTLNPIFNKQNELIYVIAIDTDITDIKKAEKKIKLQNELINYSSNYAKNIQEAILPKQNILDNFFSNNFILYKPRDVISGDFYWFYKKGNKKYVVTADSTGHSVPGAFMSIIGQMLLNEVVNIENTENLEIILYKLNDKIIKTLNQEHHNIESQNDGMDLSIICYNEDTKELELASANQMIYVFNNTEKLFYEGSVFSIGGVFSNSSNIEYHSKKITLTEDTNVYMFSDGFQDQFGGDENCKFLIKRFRKMILNNFHLDFAEQRSIYEIKFNDWKGENKQIDDVLLIGFKIKV